MGGVEISDRGTDAASRIAHDPSEELRHWLAKSLSN
jgi:hypothetical protein